MIELESESTVDTREYLQSFTDINAVIMVMDEVLSFIDRIVSKTF